MCLITFTNPSSGLSGCQCCMISVEHGIDSLKAGPGLYFWNESVPSCCGPLYVKSHSVCRATCCAWERTPVTQGECEGGCCSNGNKPLVSILSHQLLSCSLFLISQEAPWGCCLGCHCYIPLYCPQFTHAFFDPCCQYVCVYKSSETLNLPLSPLLIVSNIRLDCLYTWSANSAPSLHLWDSCYSSVTEICLLSVPHQGPLFWLCSQNNYELLTVHLLCRDPLGPEVES